MIGAFDWLRLALKIDDGLASVVKIGDLVQHQHCNGGQWGRVLRVVSQSDGTAELQIEGICRGGQPVGRSERAMVGHVSRSRLGSIVRCCARSPRGAVTLEGLRIEQREEIRELAKGYTAPPLLAALIPRVKFLHAGIPTRIARRGSKFFVYLDTCNRDTGEPCVIRMSWTIPPATEATEEMWLDWIYWCVKYAWVHELNEAMHLDGKRRRDLHDETGRTIPPPGDADRELSL